MTAELDLARIAELQDLLGADAGAIVASMLASMTGAIEEVEAALAAAELERATRAAHLCRNDALMLGANDLLQALTALEAATRDFDESRAHDALARVRPVWPADAGAARRGLWRRIASTKPAAPGVKFSEPGDD